MVSAAVTATAVSRRLSYLLRHRPDSIGLALDAAGWANVNDLLAALRAHGLALTRADLERVVAANDKQRFAFDGSGKRIRASQGHSVPVDLGYLPQAPPDLLFHGTPTRNLRSILGTGLHAGNRHAVHLSPDPATASTVGSRRGEHSVLRIDAAAMAAAGWSFTASTNGVWLVDAVPAEYITLVP